MGLRPGTDGWFIVLRRVYLDRANPCQFEAGIISMVQSSPNAFVLSYFGATVFNFGPQAAGCGPIARILANRLRQRFAFQCEHAALEGFRRIVREYVAGSLQDDWAVVVFIIDPVDRTSRNLDAEANRSLVNTQAVHSLAAERRDE